MTASNTDKKTFVVKLPGHPEVTEQGLFAEIFGNLVAREFGVSTPMPGLVEISQEFLDILIPVLRQDGLSHPYAPGMAVGSELRTGLLHVMPDSLSKEQLAEAARIYALDMLIQNPDRRHNKPNCAISDGSILTFDYEMSFSFMVALFGCKEPWNVQEVPSMPIGHIFHAVLKRNKYSDWSIVGDALAALGDGRLDALVRSLPTAWRARGIKAQEHIEKVVQQKDAFISSLQGTL